ncbi:uncharacterized protein BYT42DRAFT_553442, partial [Radiomyces spectabilis]|uniref:uncharacterized protein n=1 Tax=Radiomyces spectabilis TaxID=64574 RepID=UPI00221F4B81
MAWWKTGTFAVVTVGTLRQRYIDFYMQYLPLALSNVSLRLAKHIKREDLGCVADD